MVSMEQGAHSGKWMEKMEEMNITSGSYAKSYVVVSQLLFLEAVYSCGNSGDVLCFVRLI